MKRFFTFAVAAALAVGLSNSAWSQAGGGGGGGGAGGGASGGASAAGGTGAAGASASGTAGASGTTGRPATAGAAGATNRAGAAGNAGINSNTGLPGRGISVGTGTETGTPPNPTFVPMNRNNAAARVGANGQPISDPIGMNGRNNVSSISQTPFFTDPGARQQLNMNNTQFNSLNRAYQNAYSRYNQALNNLNPNLTADQRALQMQQLENQFNTQFGNTVNSTLTDTQAQNRFNQLNRQFQGFNAFNDPQIRQQLNLTSDQLSRIRQLSTDFRRQLQQFRRGAGNDLNNVDMTAWNNTWQQYATQLNSVLTPQQQLTWSQLIGQPFTFSPNVFATGAGTTGTTNGTTATGTSTAAGNITTNGPSGSLVAPSLQPTGQTGTAADTNPVGATTGVTVEQSTRRGANNNGTGTNTNGTQPATATTQGTTTQGTTR